MDMTQHGARRSMCDKRDLPLIPPRSTALHIYLRTCHILPLERNFSWLACASELYPALGLPVSGAYRFDPRALMPHQDLTPPTLDFPHILQLNPLGYPHSSLRSPFPNFSPIPSTANMTISALASLNGAIFGVCTACPRKA